MNWFSEPQDTKEQAQALHVPAGLFDPVAVFKTPEGKFVMGKLRPTPDWPPHSIARAIEDLKDYKMVSCCGPLLNVWKDICPQCGGFRTGLKNKLDPDWCYDCAEGLR